MLLIVAPFVSAIAQTRDSLPSTLLAWRGSPRLLGNLAPIVTDRPDFTEASSTVGLGVVQCETGYTYVHDGDTDTHSWGEPLVRVGLLANWLEFRIAAFPKSVSETDLTTRRVHTGIEDLYLGVKSALTPQASYLPEVAVVFQMTVPTGSAGFSDDRVLPGGNLLYSWDLTDDISLGGSTQVNSCIDDNGTGYGEWVQSAVLGYGLTRNLGMYGEWYSFHSNGFGHGETQHYLNGGFAFLVTEDVQCDIRGGKGINNEAEDLFLGIGFSYRHR